MPKRYRRFPRTLAAQILLVLILCTVTPLLIISMLTGHTTQEQFSRFSDSQMDILESNHLTMYKALLEEQVKSIDFELKSAAQSVAMARDFAVDLSDHPDDFPVTDLTLTESGRYYYEANKLAQGAVQLVDGAKADQATMKELARSKYLSRIFINEMSRNANLVAMYYTHPKTGSLYAAAPGNKLFQASLVEAPSLPLTTYPFYKDALSIMPGHTEVIWTQPYSDITPNGRLFTAAAPVYDHQQHLRGVVSADITISDLQRNILDTRFPNDNGYAFLLDQRGSLITTQSNSPERIGALRMQHFYDAAIHGGYLTATVNGEEHLIFARIVPSTHWLLGYVVQKQTLFQPLVQSTKALTGATTDRLNEQLIMIASISVVVCVLFALLLWTRITKPLKLLSRAFRNMGSGSFTYTAPATQAEEFQHVLHTFNTMSARIKDLLQEQMEANAMLERMVAERTAQLHRSNEELNLRLGELTHMENWRKQWFAYVSHDLKTPAAVAGGFIQAIQDGKVPAELMSSYLAKINDRLVMINQLIHNLNELSQLETGQLQPVFRTCVVVPYFRQVMRQWEDSFAISGKKLILDIPDHPVILQMDTDLITRAVNNLMDNAVKYSPVEGTVHVTVDVTSDAVYFHVKDEGIGIPESALPHIFDSFYRVDKSRNSRIPGSGLGLSIVKEIISIHGGRIGVRAQQGVGSHFYFALPLDSDLSIRTVS